MEKYHFFWLKLLICMMISFLSVMLNLCKCCRSHLTSKSFWIKDKCPFAMHSDPPVRIFCATNGNNEYEWQIPAFKFFIMNISYLVRLKHFFLFHFHFVSIVQHHYVSNKMIKCLNALSLSSVERPRNNIWYAAFKLVVASVTGRS